MRSRCNFSIHLNFMTYLRVEWKEAGGREQGARGIEKNEDSTPPAQKLRLRSGDSNPCSLLHSTAQKRGKGAGSGENWGEEFAVFPPAPCPFTPYSPSTCARYSSAVKASSTSSGSLTRTFKNHPSP